MYIDYSGQEKASVSNRERAVVLDQIGLLSESFLSSIHQAFTKSFVATLLKKSRACGTDRIR